MQRVTEASAGFYKSKEQLRDFKLKALQEQMDTSQVTPKTPKAENMNINEHTY